MHTLIPDLLQPGNFLQMPKQILQIQISSFGINIYFSSHNKQTRDCCKKYFGSVYFFLLFVSALHEVSCVCNWKNFRSVLWACTRKSLRDCLAIHADSLSPLLQARSGNTWHMFQVYTQIKVLSFLTGYCWYICTTGIARTLSGFWNRHRTGVTV